MVKLDYLNKHDLIAAVILLVGNLFLSISAIAFSLSPAIVDPSFLLLWLFIGKIYGDYSRTNLLGKRELTVALIGESYAIIGFILYFLFYFLLRCDFAAFFILPWLKSFAWLTASVGNPVFIISYIVSLLIMPVIFLAGVSSAIR